jgi:aspartyl-tRNA(Asn)/glutamyl-tRNA(Gln) amidotransferase subunit A
MTPYLPFLTIAESSRLIARKELSPVELTEAVLARIAAVDDTLCTFVTVTADHARAAARQAEAEIMRQGPRGPMHGIPYALKDVFETAGVRTTGQSRLFADYIPTSDSTVQQRLQVAGGILLGKNTTWELAVGGPSWDGVAPPSHNPWNRNHHPSGSSSGSAAAVAAGLCPAAMGTDTDGSIRMPAAACGVVGVKPTYGRVSRRGVLPNSFSHDHAGPLAWTVEDAAILLNVVAGYDHADPASADEPVPDFRATLGGGVEGLTIGVPYRWFEEEARASPEVRDAFEAALGVFRSMGASTRPILLPTLAEYDDPKKLIAIVELFSAYETALRTAPELLGSSFRCHAIAGALIRGEDYVQAMRMRGMMAAAMQGAFRTVDLIMLPTAEPAGKLEPTPSSLQIQFRNWTVPFNVGGNPALSVCSGFASNGLPLSLQIAGRLFDEATVLRAGHAYEQATPWRKRRPVLGRASAEH